MSKIRYEQPGGILVDDEGIRLGRATEIDFVGGGVTATIVGTVVTVTIPGGVSALSINNTVYVDKTYGNDATGTCERMDRPFLTIAAARAAAVAFFVGGDAPSATNRILMKLQPGYYTGEQVVLLNFLDWDFTNCVITNTADTITDGGSAVNSIIYGNSQIIGTEVGVINVSGEGTLLRVFADAITGSGGAAAIIFGAACTLYLEHIRSIVSTSRPCIEGVGLITVNNSNIVRNSTAGGAANAINNLSGNFTFNDCIIYSLLDASVVCTTVTVGTTYLNSCRLVCLNNNSSGVSNLSGETILKNTTIIATGTGVSIVAASTVRVYGACEANLPVGAGVTTLVGFITIDANVI